MLEFRILGSLEVSDETGPVARGGQRQRALLTVARDGRQILTASSDGTVRGYFCDACSQIRHLIRRAQAVLGRLSEGLTLAEPLRYLRK